MATARRRYSLTPATRTTVSPKHPPFDSAARIFTISRAHSSRQLKTHPFEEATKTPDCSGTAVVSQWFSAAAATRTGGTLPDCGELYHGRRTQTIENAHMLYIGFVGKVDLDNGLLLVSAFIEGNLRRGNVPIPITQ